MHELTRKAGQRLAELCGAEAAVITSGASGAMTLQAAACIAGTDPARIHRLPDTAGMKSEIPIYKGHRIRYDQAWRKAGASLVEYGDMRDCSQWELEQAIGPDTAALAYMVGPTLPYSALPLETVCETARAHGLPVIVDAAAMLPPRANLRKYLDQGGRHGRLQRRQGAAGPPGRGTPAGPAGPHRGRHRQHLPQPRGGPLVQGRQGGDAGPPHRRGGLPGPGRGGRVRRLVPPEQVHR